MGKKLNAKQGVARILKTSRWIRLESRVYLRCCVLIDGHRLAISCSSAFNRSRRFDVTRRTLRCLNGSTPVPAISGWSSNTCSPAAVRLFPSLALLLCSLRRVIMGLYVLPMQILEHCSQVSWYTTYLVVQLRPSSAQVGHPLHDP